MHKTIFIDMLLGTETAADFMTPNPLSLRQDATIREAVDFLTAKGISAAPVIDEGGRPVGVLSQADIIVHDRNHGPVETPVTSYYDESEPPTAGKSDSQRISDEERVRDIMTPAVFSVTPETPASRVIAEMIGLNVHRLFVVDSVGVLTGVISALDVLRHLSKSPA
jgi:CBS domain-containing protein